MWESFIISIQFFIAFFVLHCCVCQLTSSYKFVYKNIFTGIFILLFLAGYEHQRSSIDYVSLFMFATLWFAYLFVTLAIVRSSTLRILYLIEKHPRGELHFNQLTKIINTDEELKNRLFLMKTNHLVEAIDNEICLTKRAKHALSIVDFFKRLLWPTPF